MRLLTCLLLLAVSAVVGVQLRGRTKRVIRSVDVDGQAVSTEVMRQIQKERKERRILRKKKQRLRELKEEIRMLTYQIDSTATSPTTQLQKAKPYREKDHAVSNDIRWKRKLLEKLKLIVRRLDRMERRAIGSRKKKDNQKMKHSNRIRVSVPSTTLAPVETQALVLTTPSISTSITTPTEMSDKMKRLHSSVIQSRNGDNGTACATHKDCKPGRCCHRTEVSGVYQSVCVFHSLSEAAVCKDSCQCAHRLHCFKPEESGNTTKAFCKRAGGNDILHGTYLYNKDAVFADKKKKKMKKKK